MLPCKLNAPELAGVQDLLTKNARNAEHRPAGVLQL